MESFAEVFTLVKEYCKKEVSPVPYDLWIAPIQPVGFEDGKAKLSVNSSFMQDVVSKKYMDVLTRGFSEVMGFPAEVEILCVEKPTEVNPILAAEEQSAAFNRYSPEEIEKSSQGGDYEYTFATFIVGNSNKFAHAAAQAVAANPAKAYNPLFIYGGSGLGKTHLMLAIMSEIKQNHPDYNCIYIKGEEFTNQIVDAIKNDTTNEFHNKYRSADVLLVDDIQFIGGKERTQEEFFHTFETLHQNGKQIILTSDRPPKEMLRLDDRLRTRFEWGLPVDIQPPDYETRVAIIKNKAIRRGMNLPDPVLQYIAENITSNVRQIEGTVNKILAFQELMGESVDVDTVTRAVRDMFKDKADFLPSPDIIIDEVSKFYNIDADALRGQGRTKDTALARQIAMYQIRRMTNLSLKEIGKEFEGRDHTTVMHSIDRIEKLTKTNPEIAEVIKDINANINARYE